MRAHLLPSFEEDHPPERPGPVLTTRPVVSETRLTDAVINVPFDADSVDERPFAFI